MLAAVAPNVVSESSSIDFPLLTTLIVVPAVGALLTMLVPRRRPELARAIGYAVSLATLGMAIYLLIQFETGKTGYQFVESHSWLPTLGIRWTLGVDGISLFMVALSALLVPIGLLASANIENPKSFTIWMLFLETAVIGVFLALDAILFFVFFEFSLVPMYFLIAEWGHGRRRYAATKFFLLSMACSQFRYSCYLAGA